MKKAMISELKNRLSHYLQFVRRGHPVLVYDRDTLIARLEPVRGVDAGTLDDSIDHLVATGALRPPVATLPADWLRRRLDVKAPVTAMLLEERENGR